MDRKEKGQLYASYLSSHFKDIHPGDKNEFARYYSYYKKNYLPHLPQQKTCRILELGSGMGHFLYFLMTEGYHNSLGVDICEENILFCRKKGFNVTQADIFCFLAETSEFFDTIIMNDVLEHFEKPEVLQFLNLAYRRLNPGGKLILKVPNAANSILASSTRYMDFTHELLFTEESMSQVLRISGFVQIRIYPQDLYASSKNPLRYIAKFLNFVMNGTFRLIFLFYGRTTTKIFTKNIIAVAVKGQ